LLGTEKRNPKPKPVLLLSTNAVAENKTTRSKQNHQAQERVKPLIVQNYMGGVDASDIMFYTYLDERRTLKYWKKVIFCVYARMVLNVYLLYEENTNSKKMTRLQFTSSIIEDIEMEWLKKSGSTQQPGPSRDAPTAGIGLRKLPGRKGKVCVVCSRKDRDLFESHALYAKTVGMDSMDSASTSLGSREREMAKSVCVFVL
jgi:hypothetical protein